VVPSRFVARHIKTAIDGVKTSELFRLLRASPPAWELLRARRDPVPSFPWTRAQGD